MLKPNKHTDPKLTIFYVAGIIIQYLKKNEVMSYDDLLSLLVLEISDKAKSIFQYALSFLYVTGKIEYLADIDALRLIK